MTWSIAIETQFGQLDFKKLGLELFCDVSGDKFLKLWLKFENEINLNEKKIKNQSIHLLSELY